MVSVSLNMPEIEDTTEGESRSLRDLSGVLGAVVPGVVDGVVRVVELRLIGNVASADGALASTACKWCAREPFSSVTERAQSDLPVEMTT